MLSFFRRSLFLTSALAGLLLAAPTAQADGLFSYDGVLLGSFLQGRWIDALHFQQDFRYHIHRFWGGQEGRGWLNGRSIGSGILEGIQQEHGLCRPESALADSSLPLFDFQTEKKSYTFGSGLLVTTGEHDPLPRRARNLLPRLPDDLKNMVKSCLESRGWQNSTDIQVVQAFRVDLQGDGKPESLVCLRRAALDEAYRPDWRPDRPLFAGQVPDLSASPEAESLILYHSDAQQWGILDQREGETADKALRKICHFADLNGDGTLEIIVAEYRQRRLSYKVYDLYQSWPQEVAPSFTSAQLAHLPQADAEGFLQLNAPDGSVFTVPSIPDLEVQLVGTEQEGWDRGADGNMMLYLAARPLAMLRVYADKIYVRPQKFCGETWINVESEIGGTGISLRTRDLVSPEGLVLHIYDDSWVKVKDQQEQPDRISLQWSSQNGEASATLRSNAVQQDNFSSGESMRWSDLRQADVLLESSAPLDNNTFLLHFTTTDGEPLQLQSPGMHWRQWLEQWKDGVSFFRITYGRCVYESGGSAGEALMLYDAVQGDYFLPLTSY